MWAFSIRPFLGITLALLPAAALPAQERDAFDITRLPLGHPVHRYHLRLLRRGQNYGQHEDRNLTFEELMKALARYRVVLLGEEHNNLGHHLFQARVIQALAAGPGPLVVGMEFFQPKDDRHLGEYCQDDEA